MNDTAPTDQIPGQVIDIHEFRSALAQFATGITVITTTASDGRKIGVTVNSFNSVSLHPPLVLWSLANKSSSLSAFLACTHFAVNILAADQQDLAQRFSMHSADKFSGLPTDTGLGGGLLLPGCVAQFQCRNKSQYPEGDHTILIGEVLQFACSDKSPLIYHNRQYHAGF
jgi:3-hydroxy-9,10-secoandrosta-1,3,5(10)-triene-9,17-dione monooxygenase reductase component